MVGDDVLVERDPGGGPGALAEAVDVLLSYRADARAPGEQAAETFFITSLWQRRGDRWWNTFSQDTPGTR